MDGCTNNRDVLRKMPRVTATTTDNHDVTTDDNQEKNTRNSPADGRRFRRPLIPHTEMMYRFLAPLLSQQFITAATGRPRVMRYLLPWAPARPETFQEGGSEGVQRD